MVFGKVVRIHVNQAYILPSGKRDILKIRPLARLGYYDYTSVTDMFEMKIPGVSAEELAGLEGKRR